MKRKRGNKKSKSKKFPKLPTNESVENISSGNTEDSSGSADIDNDEVDSNKEVEMTTVEEKVQPEKIAEASSSVVVNKPAGNIVYGRMRIKVKTPKVLDSQVAATDATPTCSETDMSSHEVGSDKNEKSVEKTEDNENSPPDTNAYVPENLPKKAGSIKIKTSRNLGSSVLTPCTSALAQNEETRPKEPAGLRDSRSNDIELKAALEIIKKIMKMDAAEPFNTPVDPIALGIPDYLDVIVTPMDFGTICRNLESGKKYKNSEDVYKDVEFVWNNCYKYNKKGDYVVELMKRVKKNFMKYWVAGGLYCEQPQGSGDDGSQSTDAPNDSNMKVQFSSPNKKRPGVKRHKDGCLCAICKMMRRRQELEDRLRREENFRRIQEGKPLLPSPVESPYRDTSSNMENSSGPEGDSDMDEKGEQRKSDVTELQYTPFQDKIDDKSSNFEKHANGFGNNGFYQLGEGSGEKSVDFSVQGMLIDSSGEQTRGLYGDRTAMLVPNKQKKVIDKKEKAKVFEKLQQFENPQLLNLCETIFTNDDKSVWRGPHSLASNRGHSRSSSIHEVINSIMN